MTMGLFQASGFETALVTIPSYSKIVLKIHLPHCPGVGNNVPNIGHAGNVLDKPLKTQTEPRMGDRAVTAKIQIPGVILKAHA
jgi:hypothetical protein